MRIIDADNLQAVVHYSHTLEKEGENIFHVLFTIQINGKLKTVVCPLVTTKTKDSDIFKIQNYLELSTVLRVIDQLGYSVYSFGDIDQKINDEIKQRYKKQ